MNSSTINFTSPEDYMSTNLTSNGNSTHWRELRSGLMYFNVVAGLPMHFYVLGLITTGTGIASEFFNLNLTICEISYCFNALVYTVLGRFPSLNILHDFLQGVTITGRPLFQCLISVERYIAVVHPVTFLKCKPLRYKAMCCAAAWIISLISCLCSMNRIEITLYVFTFIYTVQFLLFFSIQLFCLSAVLRALKQSGPGERGREREKENHMKRQAFHLIVITTVTMLVMFIPYIITGFLFVTGKQVIEIVWFISLICFTLTGFVHPALYLHRVGKLFCFLSIRNNLRH